MRVRIPSKNKYNIIRWPVSALRNSAGSSAEGGLRSSAPQYSDISNLQLIVVKIERPLLMSLLLNSGI